MVPPNDEDDHDCGWKAYAKHQEQKLAELTSKLDAVTAKLNELAQRAKGHRSERRKRGKKMPPPVAPKSDPDETAKKRRAAEELRQTKLETLREPVPLPPEQCRCPNCGSQDELRKAGSKPSTVIQYVPGYFRKHIFERETRSCPCGYIVTAPAPARVGEKTRYDASFIAHLIVSPYSGAT